MVDSEICHILLKARYQRKIQRKKDNLIRIMTFRVELHLDDVGVEFLSNEMCIQIPKEDSLT